MHTFADILGRTKGLCVEWDVINEALHEHAVENVLGRQELADWFQQARALDPSPALYFNEYENLETPTRDGTQRLLALLKDLRQRGAPMDGVGLQSHFGSHLTPPQEVYDRISLLLNSSGPTLGPVRIAEITELDIDVQDEQAQADYLRDFMTVVFSHPDVNAIVMWGFWAGQHWLPDAALIRQNWEVKPNGIMWSNLVFGEWWTHTNLVTDARGSVAVRGFKGDYRLRVKVGCDLRELPLSLTNDLPVVLPMPVPPPAIKAVPDAAGVRLEWPAWNGDDRVEVSEALAPALWHAADPPPVVRLVDGKWQATLAESGRNQFLRVVR
jgi:endo-1,4-beta-xylanase